MGIRNIDRIRAMSLKELAPLLIKCYRTVDEYVDYLEIYRYRESYFHHQVEYSEIMKMLMRIVLSG